MAAIAIAAIILGGLLAYAKSFFGPFVFDDSISIVDNPTIRHLWPPWDALATPRANVTTQGRPILNLSFAVNFALSGTAVWSYHALNLLIHLLAGLTLFGVIRRTVARLPNGGTAMATGRSACFAGADDAPRSTWFAATVALLWTIHPLQTEAVTYIVQRAESLMGLFYLLTLYGFIRAIDTDSPRARLWWGLASAIACYLGAATKEVMVSAPVIVLAYDRTFVSGSFARAWRARWRYFLLLAGAWVVLALCLARGGGNRGGAIGFGVGEAWWSYTLTQFEAIGRYLLLSVWPHPLVFEYGAFEVKHPGEILPWAMLVIPAVAATIWAFRRRPAFGFLGVWFFAMLAPTSLVPGTSQMIVEHRMYLSLAAVLTLAVAGGYATVAMAERRRSRAAGRRPMIDGAAGATLALMAAVPLGLVTFHRNTAYRNEIALWTDTLAKRPANPLAHYLLGEAFATGHRWADAEREFETAVALHPTFLIARERLGELLVRVGQPAHAAAQFEAALRQKPDFADAHNHLGLLLAQQGHTADALAHLERAVALQPAYADAQDNLGTVLAVLGRQEAAAAAFRIALRHAPNRALTHYHLANTLVELGRGAEAITEYLSALRLDPQLSAAEFNLANTLAGANRHAEAIEHYERALRLEPGHTVAEFNLANSIAALHRYPEAVRHYEAVLAREPDNAAAETNLGSTLFQMGNLPAAEVHYLRALRLEPGAEDTRTNLERVRALLRR